MESSSLRKQSKKNGNSIFPMYGIYRNDPKLIGEQLSRPHAPHKHSHFSINSSKDNTIRYTQQPLGSMPNELSNSSETRTFCPRL